MKIQVKLLKGGDLFHIEAEPTDNIGALMQKIQDVKSDYSTDRQKLIHAGKVLKDTQTVAEIGITESDFIVCMLSNQAKPAAAAPAAAAPVAAAPAVAAPPATPQAAAPAVTTPAATIPSTPAAPVAPAAPPAAPAAPAALSAAGTQLVEMGFPEAEVRAALAAANGNADLAYEFLLTGIPEGRLRAPTTSTGGNTTGGSPQPGGNASGIQQLRNHPQLNMLKQLIQSNPAALGQVLQLIGQQSPQLLQIIQENETEFLALMNEPIGATPATPPTPPTPPAVPQHQHGGLPSGGLGPAQLLPLLAALPAPQRAQLAQQMGLSPEQLNAFMQLMASMPPEQLQQMMGAMGGLGGLGGHPGGPMGGPRTIHLTEEEMAAVNRLMELGFTQAEAAQAFLSCDRNEALAANLLLEGGWGGDDLDDGQQDGDDDMYN